MGIDPRFSLPFLRVDSLTRRVYHRAWHTTGGDHDVDDGRKEDRKTKREWNGDETLSPRRKPHKTGRQQSVRHWIRESHKGLTRPAHLGGSSGDAAGPSFFAIHRSKLTKGELGIGYPNPFLRKGKSTINRRGNDSNVGYRSFTILCFDGAAVYG